MPICGSLKLLGRPLEYHPWVRGVKDQTGRVKGSSRLLSIVSQKPLAGFQRNSGTGLFFVVLSRPAAPAAGQRLADDPSEFHHEGVRPYPDPPLHP